MRIGRIPLLAMILAAGPGWTGGLEVSGWLPCDYDFENAFRTVHDHLDRLAAVSPFWLHPLADGGVTAYEPDPANHNGKRLAQCESVILAVCRARGVRVYPSLGEAPDRFGKGLAREIVVDPARRARHIASVTAFVAEHGYDGLDLDYEALLAADRPAFTRFVAALSAALHAGGKRLTLPVHAKTAEPGNWDGPQAQDWKALGKSVDRLRVMAYDFHEDSSAPGPIAPPAWFREILAFALTQVPPGKLEMGLPTYAYDWEPGGAEEVTARGAPGLAAARKVPLLWDPASGGAHFAYDDDGRAHEVWVEDARGLPAKLRLVRQAGIAGVAVWRLGAEDADFWAALDREP